MTRLIAILAVTSLVLIGCGRSSENKDGLSIFSLLGVKSSDSDEKLDTLSNDEIIERAMHSRLGKNGFYGKIIASQTFPNGVTEIPINDLLPEILPGNSGIPEVSKQTLLANGIVALKSISLRPGASISSNLFALTQCKGFFSKDSCKGFRAELAFQSFASQEGSYISKADTISLNSNSKILGKAFANEYKIGHNAQIAEKNTPIGDLPILPKFLIGTPSENSIVAKTDRHLGPGQYKDLVIFPGVKVTLSEGYYQLRSIYINPKGSLFCSGTCVLTVKNDLYVLPKGLVTPLSGDPKDLLIYAESKDHKFWAFSFSSVSFGSNTSITANIYSPYGSVNVDNAVTVKGTIIGKDVSFGTKSKIFDSLFGDAPTAISYDTLLVPVSKVSLLANDGSEVPIFLSQTTLTFDKDYSQNIAELLGFPAVSSSTLNIAGVRFYTNGAVIAKEGNKSYEVKLVTPNNENKFDALGSFSVTSGKLTEIKILPSANYSMIRAFDTEYVLSPMFSLDKFRFFDSTNESLVERYAGEFTQSLIQESDTIADVSVQNLSSSFETIASHELITTNVTLRTNQIFLDESGALTEGDTVVVKTLGGEVDGIKLFPSHVASFTSGERVLVFIRTIDGVRYVTFGQIGKISF